MDSKYEPNLNELLSALADISNMCIGDLAMGYKLDAQIVGETIYKATGLTNPELNELVDVNKLAQKEG